MQLDKWQEKMRRAQQLCCCLMAFSFPLPFNYTAICMWLLALCWLLRARFWATGKALVLNWGTWPALLFFGLYAFSYTYSDDKAQSSFDITQKLSFVLLPVLLGAGTTISRRNWEQILLSFSAGITCVGLLCMYRSGLQWQATGKSEFIFYHKLVSGLDANAVYMAWYTLFSLSALLLFRWQHFFRGRAAVWKWLSICIQLLFFILLSSRMLLVILCIITLPIYLSNLSRSFRLSAARVVATVIVSTLLILAIVFTDNPIRQRFDDVTHNDIHQSFLTDYHYVDQDFNNLTLRLFVWRVGVENIKEHKLWLRGAGNGDVHVLQNHRIAAYGIRDMDDARHKSAFFDVDLHNMYLQTTLATGIPGLVVFLLLIVAPFFVLGRSGDNKLFLFSIFPPACLCCRNLFSRRRPASSTIPSSPISSGNLYTGAENPGMSLQKSQLNLPPQEMPPQASGNDFRVDAHTWS